jgi:hypothetical protein
MLTSEHFCAADLWSEKSQKYAEVDVQIVAVAKGEIVGDKGRSKGMPFVTMKSARTGENIPKRLGLNATNCKTVASIAGSPNTDKWKDLWITLYVTQTEVGRERVDAIRIRPEAAKAPSRKRDAPMSDDDKREIERQEANNA